MHGLRVWVGDRVWGGGRRHRRMGKWEMGVRLGEGVRLSWA